MSRFRPTCSAYARQALLLTAKGQRGKRLLCALSLSVLSACGDDVLLDGGTGSEPKTSTSQSAQSDYVPSLGLGVNSGATRTGPVVDDGWNPFPENPTGDGLPTPSGRTASTSSINTVGTAGATSSSSSLPSTPTGPGPTGSSGGTTDSGITDSGTTDSGTSDSGTTDSGTTDTGTTDTGTTDTGTTDTGTTDTGTTDTGTTDTGTTDTGTTDSSTSGVGTTGTDSTATGATQTFTTTSMDTSSDSSGSDTENPTREAEPVESDPMGTQFGLRIELSIRAPFPKTQDLRALVFTFDAQAVQPAASATSRRPTDEAAGEVAAQPQIQRILPAPYQPRLPFNGDGKTALVLPTPLAQNLDEQTRRSLPHAVTVYRDLNGDGVWNEREPFVAALPQTLSYIGGTSDKAERWILNPNAASLINPPAEDPIPKVLELTRLDRFRVPAQLQGYTNGLGKHADFVAMLSTAEVLDLDSNFVPTLRPFDVGLRSLPEGPFTLPAPTLPPMPRTGAPSVEIPGIRPAFTATRWLVSYRRPLGAPVEAPGEFLTRDSTLISGVCVTRGFNAGEQGSFYRELVALWLDDGAWASDPQGALYAAWLNLGVGWNFVPVATSQDTELWVDAASAMTAGTKFSPTWEEPECSYLMQ